MPHMFQPTEYEKFTAHVVRLPAESRAGAQSLSKMAHGKWERQVALVFTVEIEGGAGLEIPTYRPGLRSLNFSTGTRGKRAQVFLAAYRDLGQKRGKRRDETESFQWSSIKNKVRLFTSTTKGF